MVAIADASRKVWNAWYVHSSSKPLERFVPNEHPIYAFSSRAYPVNVIIFVANGFDVKICQKISDEKKSINLMVRRATCA